MGKVKLTAEEMLLKEANKRTISKIISNNYEEYLLELEKNIIRLGGNKLLVRSNHDVLK